MNSTRKTVVLPCACANLHRADRVVAQLYDAALRPVGLRVTQFTLLQSLHLAAEASQGQLAALLEIDSTTLTRTLAPLRRKGWLRSVPGGDRRELLLSLTAAGKRSYKRALPHWQTAQKRLRQALGEDTWHQLIEAAVRVAEIAPGLGRSS
jgi:DNA-binding MarR family transcriptional regulator